MNKTKRQGTILVVDDNKGILAAVELLLRPQFARVITTSAPDRIRTILHDEPVDVVLLDMNFSAGINSGNEGFFWLSDDRSEERRVGKECRSRWSPYH